MVKSIKAIIVDDELGACKNLEAILNEYCKFITVLGHAQNTIDAELLIKKYKPDLLFLDIQMPNESGINFIKRIWPIDFEIVFVTAYDQYAIRTFKLNALDYILKPININYLIESTQRIRDIINTKKRSIELDFYIQENGDNHVVLRVNGAYKKVAFDDILYLSADGSYSSFVIQEDNTFKTVLTTYNLAYYEEFLPKVFIRCHRSFLVNIDRVISLNSNSTEKKLVLPNNKEIPISRRRLQAIKTALK